MAKKELNLSDTIKTWPDRIKAAGKNQQQAADESGLSRGGLSQYINGVNSPNIKKFEKFENYLRGLGV